VSFDPDFDHWQSAGRFPTAPRYTVAHDILDVLAAWHLPGVPVGLPSRWAATSNVKGQTTYPVNRGRVGREGREGSEGQSQCGEARREWNRGGGPKTLSSRGRALDICADGVVLPIYLAWGRTAYLARAGLKRQSDPGTAYTCTYYDIWGWTTQHGHWRPVHFSCQRVAQQDERRPTTIPRHSGNRPRKVRS